MRWPIAETSFLRPLAAADATDLHSLIESNRATLARWLPWAAAQTLEDTVGFIRRAEEQLAQNDGFQAAVVCDGDIAGVVGYVGVDWNNRSTSLGYWLGERYQGSGTMTGAVRLLVEHGFSEWDLNRIAIRAASGNLRSRAIPERLGFQQDGILREAELVGGRYLDSVVYSLLARDWRARSQGQE